MIYVGTSGFSYKEWKGSFYPEDLKAADYLAFYASRFPTTEINASFYRIPNEKTAAQWASQVPESFRFALKLNQRITHRKQLRDVDEEMGWFMRGVGPLGEKLGCILVQLPPWLRQDPGLLEQFLVKHGGRVPLAFEFRHQSWFETTTFDLLRNHGAALCAAESEKMDAVREATGSFSYARLRRTPYAEAELQDWAGWIKAQQGDFYAFLKHEDEAPAMALDLQRLVEK